MRTKVLLALTAIAAVLYWVLWQFAAGEAQPDQPAESPGSPARESTSSEPTAPGQRTALADNPADRPFAIIKGRCLDNTGSAVEGGRITVKLWSQLEDRDLESPEPATTDREGRFVHEIRQQTVSGYDLHIEAAGFAALDGNWRPLARGAVEDYGDLILQSGLVLSGVLVDERGSPLGGRSLQMTCDYGRGWAAPWQPRERDWFKVTTGADGRFQIEGLVTPGSWNVRLYEYPPVRIAPEHILIPGGRRELSVRLVVPAAEPAASMRGRVVDEHGNPLNSVVVRYDESLDVETTKDGTFSIARSSYDSDGPFRLRLWKSGFDDPGQRELRTWGDHEIRLTMRRGNGLAIRVTDAAKGRPVEHFGVRILPAPGNKNVFKISYQVGQAPYSGRHESGVLHIPAMTRGRHLIQVVPTDKLLLRSQLVSCAATDGIVDIQLAAAVSRTVRVVRPDGSAAVGTSVELLEPGKGVKVDADTSTFAFSERSISTTSDANFALLREETETDAKGETRVTGPVGTLLTIRARGPSHPPAIVADVRLDTGTDPIVIEVSTGALVTGRVRPLQLLQESKRLGGDESGMLLVRMERTVAPGGKRGAFEPHYDLQPVPFDQEGRFRVEHVPPGEWELRFEWANLEQVNGLGRSSTLQRLTVAEGGKHDLDLDLRHLLTGDVKAAVSVDGRPLCGGDVSVYSDKMHGRFNWILENIHAVRTDGQGRFRVFPFTGRHRIIVHSDDRARFFPADEIVTIDAGAEVRITFNVRTRRIQLRVTGADGRPRSGVSLRAGDRIDQAYQRLPLSDTSGRVSCRLPAADSKLWVVVKPRVHGGADDVVRLIPVGTLNSSTRGVQTIELPRSAGY